MATFQWTTINRSNN